MKRKMTQTEWRKSAKLNYFDRNTHDWYYIAALVDDTLFCGHDRITIDIYSNVKVPNLRDITSMDHAALIECLDRLEKVRDQGNAWDDGAEPLLTADDLTLRAQDLIFARLAALS